MTLLLLLAGVGSGATPDTHDLAFDSGHFRKTQRRLAKAREKLLEKDEEDRKELRKTLNKVIYGEPEPEKLTEGIVDAPTELPADIPVDKLGEIAARVQDAKIKIAKMQSQIIAKAADEYSRSETNRKLREATAKRQELEFRRRDEEDIERILALLARED